MKERTMFTQGRVPGGVILLRRPIGNAQERCGGTPRLDVAAASADRVHAELWELRVQVGKQPDGPRDEHIKPLHHTLEH